MLCIAAAILLKLSIIIIKKSRLHLYCWYNMYGFVMEGHIFQQLLDHLLIIILIELEPSTLT